MNFQAHDTHCSADRTHRCTGLARCVQVLVARHPSRKLAVQIVAPQPIVAATASEYAKQVSLKSAQNVTRNDADGPPVHARRSARTRPGHVADNGFRTTVCMWRCRLDLVDTPRRVDKLDQRKTFEKSWRSMRNSKSERGGPAQRHSNANPARREGIPLGRVRLSAQSGNGREVMKTIRNVQGRSSLAELSKVPLLLHPLFDPASAESVHDREFASGGRHGLCIASGSSRSLYLGDADAWVGTYGVGTLDEERAQ